MQISKIEWTEATWNPLRGCSRTSEGCRHCYAERMAARFCGPGKPFEGFATMSPSGPQWTGRVEIVEALVEQPLRWRKPKTIFVNSMSDLFHERIPAEEICRVFEVMGRADWHRFQVLTKRSGRLRELSPTLKWPRNVWIGGSIENAAAAYRADDLRKAAAAVKFLSLEPLLGPLDALALDGIDWVIVGGESGPGARAMDAGWVRDIRDRCVAGHIPFFFKQWGGVNKKRAGRLLDGRTWDETPEGRR